MLLQINHQNPQKRLIDQAVEILTNDGVIIYPTDTVYGLGCSLFSKRALERISLIKKIDAKKPLTFICADERQIQEYTQGIPKPMFKLMRQHLPGPYTFIFHASKSVPKIMLNKRKTLGFRWPDNPIATQLVQALGHPILSSSLRTSEDTLYDDPEAIHEEYGKRVDLVIDGGPIFAENSTIIDFTQAIPELIRQGKGDTSWLELIES